MRRIGGLAFAFIAFAACSPQAPAQNAPAERGSPQTGLRQVPLTIQSATGLHRFIVQIAETSEQQEHGLMFTRSIGPEEGMIFPYDPPQDVAFWMKNTLIPLDMLFIRADGTIARIATAKPLDETPVPAGEPVAAVLEIRGGRAGELGIRDGDRVMWKQ